MTNSFTNQPYHRNTMSLSGQGHIFVSPDMAVIRLGVQTIGEDLKAIQSENAQISQKILDALKDLGVEDIKTFQYSIEKNYEYKDGIREEKGFIVRNILEIKIDQMDQVGTIIDTAVKNGANVVDFVSFEVSMPEFYYQQALNMAIRNAHQKSISIAKQMGLPMAPIPIRIVENSLSPMPASQVSLSREQSLTTPIEPGLKRIDAFVTVEFLYSGQSPL